MKIFIEDTAEHVIVEENVTRVVEVSDAIFPEGINSSVIQAEGDLIVGLDSESVTRLAIGANNSVLMADSGASGKIKWGTPTASIDPAVFHARLTLSTGVPVTTSDVTAAPDVYLTPLTGHGNTIGLYYNSAWGIYTLTEISASLNGKTADKNYDVFVYTSDGATISLELVVWTNDTTRATALTTQDGVYVKTGDTTKRYAGTIRITNVEGQCEDSASKRFVWNMYNRVERPMRGVDTTNSWTYTTATWRAANNSSTYGVARVGVVLGLNEDMVEAAYKALAYNGDTVSAASGVGIDSTSTNSAQIYGGCAGGTANFEVHSLYRGFVGIGFHYIQSLEISGAIGTTTWYGDNNLAYIQTGLQAKILA